MLFGANGSKFRYQNWCHIAGPFLDREFAVLQGMLRNLIIMLKSRSKNRTAIWHQFLDRIFKGFSDFRAIFLQIYRRRNCNQATMDSRQIRSVVELFLFSLGSAWTFLVALTTFICRRIHHASALLLGRDCAKSLVQEDHLLI